MYFVTSIRPDPFYQLLSLFGQCTKASQIQTQQQHIGYFPPFCASNQSLLISDVKISVRSGHSKQNGLQSRIVHLQTWIGLHLLNDDTRPQRPISRLPQVGFSQLFMLYRQITESNGVVKMWWLISIANFVSWWMIPKMCCTEYMAFHIR